MEASQQEKQLEAMAAQDMFKKLSAACFVKGKWALLACHDVCLTGTQ